MRSLVALCVTVTFYNSYTQKIPIYIFFTFIALFYFNFSFLFILYFVERSSWLFNVQFFSSWILICFCDNDANTLHYTVWTQKNKVILQFHILLAIHFNLFISLCLIFYVSFSEKEQTFTFDSFLLPSHHHYHQMHFFRKPCKNIRYYYHCSH